MRIRASLVLLLALLLPGSGGCREHSSPRPPVTLPAGPPGLSLKVGRQVVTAAVAAERWPDPVERPEPPGGTRLFVEAGHEITLMLEGAVPAPATARVELWNYWFWYLSPGIPALCTDIDSFTVRDGRVTFAWTMPRPEAWADGNMYTLRVTAGWGDAEAAYQASLQLVGEETWMAVKDTSARFFEAAWAGDETTAGALLSSYQQVAWDHILWRADTHEYRLRAGPVVTVSAVGPEPAGPYAETELSYTVQVLDRQTGTAVRWDFVERHELLQEAGGWRVNRVSRSGVPWESAGGTEPGRQVEAVGDGPLLRVGPFSSAGAWFGQAWSDDGDFFALAAANCDRWELWAFRRDGSGLYRLLRLDQYPSAWRRPALYVLNWAPDRPAVRFAVVGPQLDGPHAGREGFRVAEATYPGGEIRELAFIPRRNAQPRLTADGTSVIFQASPDLWRVDLASGETVHLAGDLPLWDGLFHLHYSPSGWRGAYSYDKSVFFFDLRAGTRREIPLPEAETVFFAGWGSGELAGVALALWSDCVQGENATWPAAATSLRFYDPFASEPVLRLEVRPPGADPSDRVGLWDWDPSGRTLAYTVGPVVAGEPGPLGYEIPVQAVRELWLWQDGGVRRLAALSGRAQALGWKPGGEAVEIWWTCPYESRTQTGARVYLDGRTEDLVRDPHLRPLPAPPGGTWYAVERDDTAQRVVAHDPAGRRVIAEGQFGISDARVEGQTLIFMAEPLEGIPYPWAGYLHLLGPLD